MSNKIKNWYFATILTKLEIIADVDKNNPHRVMVVNVHLDGFKEVKGLLKLGKEYRKIFPGLLWKMRNNEVEL